MGGAAWRAWVAWATAIAVVVAGLALLPALASAGTITWGSSLSATPTLDTANGAYGNSAAGSGPTVISPNPHYAEDLSIWNTALSNGASFTAPQGGQITAINVEGCSRQATSAPDQGQAYDGIQSNEIVFQAMIAQSGVYTVTADAADDANGNPFTLPWCSNSSTGAVTTGAVNTSTITTYTPIHLCVSAGGTIDFHNIGGYIPAANGAGPWYPQGVPMFVLAAQSGSAMASYTGINSTYSPSDTGAEAGFGTEPNEELTMQLVEGTGGDAYGLCPGGTANEGADSNTVICDYGTATDGNDLCDKNGNPIPPGGGGGGSGSGGTGGSGGSGGGGSTPARAPRLSGLKFNATSIKATAGLTVDYTDSLAAKTTLTTMQEKFGRKRGTKCVTRITQKLRHAASCHFFAKVATARHTDTAGTNSVHLSTKQLTKDNYQIDVVATLNGKSSKTLVKNFKVTAAAKGK